MTVPSWLYTTRYYREFSNDEFFSPDPSIPPTSEIHSLKDFITVVKLCKIYDYDNDGIKFPLSVYSYYFSNLDNCKPYIEIDAKYSCLASFNDNSIKRNLIVKSLSVNVLDWKRTFLIELDGISTEFIIDGFDYCMIDEIERLKFIKENYVRLCNSNVNKNISILTKYESHSEIISEKLKQIKQIITVFGIVFIGVEYILINNICITKDLIYPFICMFLKELEKFSSFFDEVEDDDEN